MEKLYLDISVYDAFEQRLDYIFSQFENIYVSFSGGKDSGLLLNLVVQYMRDRGIKRRIGLMHQDFEAQYSATTEFVTKMFEKYAVDMDAYWICLPMGSKTSLSNYELYWYPWDPQKKDIWVRPMPDNRWVINLDNCPFDFYREKMLQEDLYKGFSRWYHNRHGGRTVSLIGMRCDESLSRYSAIVNKKYAYKGQNWISHMYKDVWSASPLYDWTVEDIWTANAKFGFEYNRIYDLMYKAGVPLSRMRVASPFNEWAAQSLNMYRVLEPAVWAKLVGRVQGANFAAIYGDMYDIVDGFHRYRVMLEHDDIRAREGGMLPVSVIDKPIDERMASTIRHNRARGSHDVDLMSNIVAELHEIGRSDAWIAKHLGMDQDEILRLKQITGLAALFRDKEFSIAWNAIEETEEKP